ncbi:hypothetical protein C8R43DRAFT_965632 [Mycena crocata]|nr:hypothetical protein C8R43DRAFT_965632 [Mycena crocata]
MPPKSLLRALPSFAFRLQRSDLGTRMALPPPHCNISSRRTLRSGKEFSAFDLALAIFPPFEFDVGNCLRQRLSEQDELATLEEEKDALGTFHGDEEYATPVPSDVDMPVAIETPLPPALPPNAPLSAKQRDKVKSRARRDKKRDAARAASDNPLLKSITLKRMTEAKSSALEMDIDASKLPHSKPAWVGDRWASKEEFEFGQPQPPHDLSNGLGGLSYTQAEVDALSGTQGFMYINWLGELTIPILDCRRRVIAVLGGKPRDLSGWQAVTDGASQLLQERLMRIRLTEERLHHHRAQESFAALARGWSHGGGQTEPGELVNNVANTVLTDELLAHEHFKRLARFANILFAMWAPLLFAFCKMQLVLLAAWKPSMRPNFVDSAFAACTFNFGPRAITAPHIDFANLAWGWCAITALGLFDPDRGGHLILWDLRLVIRFPPGATILIPSALIRHSNIPIHAHEHRCSFVQYSAGGLFRWVRNGFKTDEDFEASASAVDLAARETEKEGRWQQGMAMFSVIDDL